MIYKLVAFCFFIAAALVQAESVLPVNIQQGKPLPGSTSPDKKYFLLEVSHSETTQNSVIIATTDRTQNLGTVDVHTEYSTDKSHKGRTTIVWNPDSKRFAIHDALSKHSKASIHRLTVTDFERVPTHDILAAACGHFGIKPESISSSGQVPTSWPSGDLVFVEVAVRLKNGTRMKHTFGIHAPLQGPAVQQ